MRLPHSSRRIPVRAASWLPHHGSASRAFERHTRTSARFHGPHRRGIVHFDGKYHLFCPRVLGLSGYAGYLRLHRYHCECVRLGLPVVWEEKAPFASFELRFVNFHCGACGASESSHRPEARTQGCVRGRGDPHEHKYGRGLLLRALRYGAAYVDNALYPFAPRPAGPAPRSESSSKPPVTAFLQERGALTSCLRSFPSNAGQWSTRSAGNHALRRFAYTAAPRIPR